MFSPTIKGFSRNRWAAWQAEIKPKGSFVISEVTAI